MSFIISKDKIVDYYVPKTTAKLKDWIRTYYLNINRVAKLTGMRKSQLLAIYHSIRQRGL